MSDQAAVTSFLQKYTKQYQGSLYSVPFPMDTRIAEDQGRLAIAYSGARINWVILESPQSLRPRTMNTFTGQKQVFPPGVRVGRYVGRLDGQMPPDFVLSAYNFLMIYLEDIELAKYVDNIGFHLVGVKISPNSELIGVFSDQASTILWYPEDEVTLAELDLDIAPDVAKAINTELIAVPGFRDDYPFYNKNNAWGAASLRGFKPRDFLYGVKPAEMSGKWRRENPLELSLLTCQDTMLAEKCPATMEFLKNLPFGSGFERVRFLRLTEGELIRHCDITDHDLGTRDGQICRLHIPIVTNDTVRSQCWDLAGNPIDAHLEPWRAYYMDIRKPHAAMNKQGSPRIHLQIDVLADDRMRAMILAGRQL